MSIALLIDPLASFWNNTGSLLASTIEVYDGGTAKLSGVFSDSTSNIKVSNPVSLTGGRASIFVDSGISYKIILKSTTGDVLKTIDNLYTQAGSVSADNVSYDNTTSGLTAIQVQAALDELAGLSGIVTNWGGILGDILNQTDLQAQFAANKRLTIFTLATATEIADITHANNKVNMTNSGAATYQIDLGIFADGDQILIEQEGTGKVTVIAGAGVVLRSSGGLFATSGKDAIIAVINNGSDVWTVAGDRA